MNKARMFFPHLTNSEGLYLDQVQLTGMLTSCVIGIFPNERNRKQPVTIDLCLYLNTRKAANSTNINDTIDYAAAVKEVEFIVEQCEFLLIESAVEAVCRYFLATYVEQHALPQVEAVVVRIGKPVALTRGVIPTIQILRRRETQAISNIEKDEIAIHRSQQATLSLRRVKPGEQLNLRNLGWKGALTLGKWCLEGSLLPSHSAVLLTPQKVEMTLSHSQNEPQLVLLFS